MPPIKTDDMRDFAKRAKSILWREEIGKKKIQYSQWQTRVKNLQNTAGYNLSQAIVQASKDFPCLYKLFREYDVSQFDPNPGSHPNVPAKAAGEAAEEPLIECEGKEASYRENLNWAIQAAGEYLRTGSRPRAVPNDQSYYLYVQATESPKEFMQRIGQVESKGDGELDEQRSIRKAGQRSIREIEEMLVILDDKFLEVQ